VVENQPEMLSSLIPRPRAAVLACLLGLGHVATAVAAGNVSPPLANQAGLEISTDGSCGNGITCEGSVWGRCCSAHGYCGNDDAYCGAECQVAFGACGLGTVTCPAPSDVLPSTVTVSVCATRITVTATRWETASTTFTVGGGGGNDRTVTVTAPPVTSTVTAGSGRVSTVTVTTTVGSGGRTATVTTTSISTRITFHSTTTIVTLTSCGGGSTVPTVRPTQPTAGTSVIGSTVVGKGKGSTTTKTTATSTTIGSQTKVPKPSPVLVGVISNCRYPAGGGIRASGKHRLGANGADAGKKWHQIVEGDTCRKVSQTYNITSQQL